MRAAARDIASLLRVHGSDSPLETAFAAGQQAFDAGEFEDAAKHWNEAIQHIDAEQGPLATRETLVLSLVSALSEAGLRAAAESGEYYTRANQALDDHIDMTEGDASEPIAEAKARIADLVETLPRAQREQAGNQPDRRDRGPRLRGRELIVTGAAIGLVGLSAGAALVGIGIHDWQADANRSDGKPTEDGQRQSWRRAIITGSSLAAVSVVSGIVLIVGGVKRNERRRMTWAPMIGSEVAGLRLGFRM
ncbi:MAG: hypothetical protein B7733_23895 [Myxococcales bacterium FL481]|nr:MAG: hypothetical protein B7733_23895 [Myxococcales bacterium FL481]